ncbi:MAG: hypothetical protein SCAL_000923 [Candidatus Syntrophoarchaeum caldarius]|uniref:Uncharacterized protein n=1 Tax=Candidatus Syntropharchaeum caldarium TaxID=1838285 RepID=A0A1F2PAK8_9EURY|nr:MAG: hypothetical protein SCAL_000923 [Candidatus Syntrophoarchaeum caldarius]
MEIEVNLTRSGARLITLGRVELELSKDNAKTLKEMLIKELESKA